MRALGALYAGLYMFVVVIAGPSLASAESVTPVYEWSHYLEPSTVGFNQAVISEIAAAPDGSVYAIGYFEGTVDFDPRGAGDSRSSDSSSNDIFVTKRAADGTYQWTRTIGSSGSEILGGHPQEFIEVDSAGAVYYTGLFNGTVNFNPTGTDNRTAISTSDWFATKWNADGTYGWTYVVGSPAVTLAPYESINALDVQADGTVYFGGDFSGSTDFDSNGAGDVHTVVNASDRDAFITKINSNGSYGWTATFGGDNREFVDNNMVEIAGNGSGVYVPVEFDSPSIDADPGIGTSTINQVGGTGNTIAIIKLDTNGNHLWSVPFGNNLTVNMHHLGSDPAGAIYFDGKWGGTLDFDPTAGTDSDTATDSQEGYIMKMNSDGTYGWSKRFKNNSSINYENHGFQVTAEAVYNHILLNPTLSWDINHPDSPIIITPVGDYDNYITKWSHDGTHQWTKAVAGTAYEQAYEISVNQSCDSVYALGESYGGVGGTNIPLDDQGSDTRLAPDTGAFFMTRFSSNGNYSWSNFVDTAVDYFYVTRADVASGDSIYYSGSIQGSAVNLNSFGSDAVDTNGLTYDFITKLSNTNYRQHVVNLGLAVNALEEFSGDSARLGDIGVTRTSSTSVRVPDADNNLVIADIDTDLSCDRDWSNVTGDSTASQGAAYIAELTNAEGTASTLDLYVPVTESIGVGICPGATSISSLNDSCSGYYELLSGDPGLTTINIGGQDYWQVLGISDSGGFNLTSLSSPGGPSSPDTPGLVETGSRLTLFTMTMGLMLIMTSICVAQVGRRHYYRLNR